MCRRFAAAPALLLAAMGCGDPTVTDDPRADVLRINEVMASNGAACADDAGEFDDWIELKNGGDAELVLDGITITDDRATPDKVALDGLTIPAGGRLLLVADGTPAQGATHLPFRLSAAGEELLLFIGQAIIDEVTWTSALTDVSLARFPDGTGDFATCALSTCGEDNGAACE
jgi:hypothetical protein